MKRSLLFVLSFSFLAAFQILFFASASDLTVNWADSHYGQVNVTPQAPSGGGGCVPGSCSFTYFNYTNGTIVRLTASTINNGKFLGWSGACAGTNPVCQVVMSVNRIVNATFGPENNTNQTHLACVSNTCTVVNGAGNNTCAGVGSFCQSGRLACVNNACTVVNGTGPWECSRAGQNCTLNSQHLVCVGNACSLVQGAGINECNVPGSTCISTRRLACVGATCTMISGSGSNLCGPEGGSCGANNQTHLECRNFACTNVSGAGNNTCRLGKPCAAIANATRFSPPIGTVTVNCNWFKKLFHFGGCRF